MAAPGAELLVSARADAVVPALVVGLGGVWTEALADVAVIPLPATPERVEAALRGLRGAPLLTGHRGRPALAIGAAAQLAARAGDLLLDAGLELLELNPVIVGVDRRRRRRRARLCAGAVVPRTPTHPHRLRRHRMNQIAAAARRGRAARARSRSSPRASGTRSSSAAGTTG